MVAVGARFLELWEARRGPWFALRTRRILHLAALGLALGAIARHVRARPVLRVRDGLAQHLRARARDRGARARGAARPGLLPCSAARCPTPPTPRRAARARGRGRGARGSTCSRRRRCSPWCCRAPCSPPRAHAAPPHRAGARARARRPLLRRDPGAGARDPGRAREAGDRERGARGVRALRRRPRCASSRRVLYDRRVVPLLERFRERAAAASTPSRRASARRAPPSSPSSRPHTRRAPSAPSRRGSRATCSSACAPISCCRRLARGASAPRRTRSPGAQRAPASAAACRASSRRDFGAAVTLAVGAVAGTLSGGFGAHLGTAILVALLHTTGRWASCSARSAGALVAAGALVVGRARVRPGACAARRCPAVAVRLALRRARFERLVAQRPRALRGERARAGRREARAAHRRAGRPGLGAREAAAGPRYTDRMTITDGTELVDPHAYARTGYPHATWARLRRESPVHWCEPARAGAVLGGDAPRAHLRDLEAAGPVPERQGHRARHARGRPRASRAARRAPSTRCRPSSRWTRRSTASSARWRAPGSRRTRSARIDEAVEASARRLVDRLYDAQVNGEGALRLRDGGRGAASAAHPLHHPRRAAGRRAAHPAPHAAALRRATTRSSSARGGRPRAGHPQPRHRVPPVLRQDHRRPAREAARRPRERARQRRDRRRAHGRRRDARLLPDHLHRRPRHHAQRARRRHARADRAPGRAREAAPRSEGRSSPTRSRRSCAGPRPSTT